MRRPSRKTSVYALAVKVNIKTSKPAIKSFLNMTRLSLSPSDVLRSKGTRARKWIFRFAIRKGRQSLLIRARGRALRVAVARFHRDIRLIHFNANLAPIAIRRVCIFRIVTKRVLATQFLSDSRESISKLLRVICLKQPAAGFIGK